MEEPNKIEALVDHVKEYVETRYELIILNAQDKISDVLSSIASVFIIAILSVFILLFLSIGAAWWIGIVTGNPSIGFFSIAGFYFLLTIIAYAGREKWIRLPIINALIKKISVHEED